MINVKIASHGVRIDFMKDSIAYIIFNSLCTLYNCTLYIFTNNGTFNLLRTVKARSDAERYVFGLSLIHI